MIAVGVVTHDSAAVLPGLLDSLPAALAGVPTWRLVVADNASGDGSCEVVRRHAPHARILQMGGNRGYAAGVNACAAAVPDAAALLVLNPDVRLRPGTVAALATVLDRRGGRPPAGITAGSRAGSTAGIRVGIAVPRLVDPHGRLAYSLRRRPTVARALGEALLGGTRARRHPALSEVVADPLSYQQPSTPDWASGAVMLVSRECLAAVGTWDESFFLYSEETDFALRARDAGFVVRLVPGAEAVHVGGESHVSPRLWALLTVNRVRLFARRNGPVRTLAFWSAVALGEALRSVRGGAGGATHRAALGTLLRHCRGILGGQCVDFSP